VRLARTRPSRLPPEGLTPYPFVTPQLPFRFQGDVGRPVEPLELTRPRVRRDVAPDHSYVNELEPFEVIRNFSRKDAMLFTWWRDRSGATRQVACAFRSLPGSTQREADARMAILRTRVVRHARVLPKWSAVMLVLAQKLPLENDDQSALA